VLRRRPSSPTGWATAHHGPVNLAIGRLGAKIAEAIPDFRPSGRGDGTEAYWFVIADGDYRLLDGHFV
jgi:hypothetical protein